MESFYLVGVVMATTNRIEPEPPCVDIVAICTVKGRERYIINVDDTPLGRGQALQMMGRWASNPELSFSWYDAAVMAGKLRGDF